MHGNVFLRELRGNDQHESREAVRWHGAHSLVGSFRGHRRRGCSVGRRSFGRRDGGSSEWAAGVVRYQGAAVPVTARDYITLPTNEFTAQGEWTSILLALTKSYTIYAVKRDNGGRNWEGQERDRAGHGSSPAWIIRLY